jgi:hypothetical protein
MSARRLPIAAAAFAFASWTVLSAPMASAAEPDDRDAPDVSGLPPFDAGGLYLGRHEMGLYPGGKAEIPEAHRKAGERIASAIRPLDAAGNPDEKGGRIIALVLGHSNCRMYFDALGAHLAGRRAELHASFELLTPGTAAEPVCCSADGRRGSGGQQLPEIRRLEGPVWERAAQLLSRPGYSPMQVQVLFLHTTYHQWKNPGKPPGPFPETMEKMRADLAAVLEHCVKTWPNLRIAYLTPDGLRRFTGFEPHVWQEAFALKWLIGSQIEGREGTAFEDHDGKPRKLPWLAWGPYIWDGSWDRSFFTDGVHPAPKARAIFVRKYWDRLRDDPVAGHWLLKGYRPGRASGAGGSGEVKTEAFDRDPGWPGVNNRSARDLEPVTVRQDFGFSRTNRAGGGGYRSAANGADGSGEIGGTITAAGEAAWYGKVIGRKTLNDPLRASGTLACPDGAFHALLGFFNSGATNEWRTPSTIALRLNGRGDHFFAYVEYCTSRWRAGGDTTPFPSRKDPATGRTALIGFPSGGKPHRWTLAYDPRGSGGKGLVTATIDDATAACELGEGHKGDGAAFDRFGILNVVKSADSAGEIYFDDIAIGGDLDDFDEDPGWEGRNNRLTYRSTIVRPRFDFGFSPTNFAGGRASGELGGTIFRGDCRYPERMASIGDPVGPLTLEKPFRASGKVAMTRGVSDSTTLFGFFGSVDAMRRNDSQSEGIPEGVAGIHIEGPSSEGFFFYPVCRARGGNGRCADPRSCPRILPDGASHDWSFDYDPEGAGGKGRITVVLDGRRAVLDLEEGIKASGTRLDRFGIVTSWIDGNRQEVYWDDLTYTTKQ